MFLKWLKSSTKESAVQEEMSILLHQLRTPLTALQFSYELLQSGDVGELTSEQHRILESGKGSIRKMQAFIETALANDFLTGGTPITHLERSSLEEIVADVLSTVQVQADKKQQTIVRECTSPQQPVLCNRQTLWIAISNVIENAIKYSPVDSTITVGIRYDEARVFVFVRDTGEGIPPDEVEDVFKKFVRSRASQSLTNDGSGLGLYVVQKLVTAQGGTVTYHRDGDETVFTISMPISV